MKKTGGGSRAFWFARSSRSAIFADVASLFRCLYVFSWLVVRVLVNCVCTSMGARRIEPLVVGVAGVEVE